MSHLNDETIYADAMVTTLPVQCQTPLA